MPDRPDGSTPISRVPPEHLGSSSWHQDLTYWGLSDDDAQITIWLALSPATIESGCMQMLWGSRRAGRAEHVTPDRRRPDDVLDFGQYIEGVDLDAAAHVPLDVGEMSMHHDLDPEAIERQRDAHRLIVDTYHAVQSGRA